LLGGGLSRDVPDVFEVPVVEAVDGRKLMIAELEGSVRDIHGSGSRACAQAKAFGDGAGAEGVEDYGDGEVDQIEVETGGFGTAGLSWRRLASCGHRGVHGRNVTFFRRYASGVGLNRLLTLMNADKVAMFLKVNWDPQLRVNLQPWYRAKDGHFSSTNYHPKNR
jgi:hypothetical protein